MKDTEISRHIDMAGFTLYEPKAQQLAKVFNQDSTDGTRVVPVSIETGSVKPKYALKIVGTAGTLLTFAHDVFKRTFTFQERMHGHGSAVFEFVL